jgi:class 3 adenylate cyclase
LERLLSERLRPGADQAAIDARIWNLFGEDWAVMFTDLSGFSRGVEAYGIIHFLQTIHESLRVLAPLIEAHEGILLKVEADSMMVIFRQPNRALHCAVEMQRTLRDYNADKAGTDRLELCVGLGFGRMLRIGDGDVYGAEVNAASKLGEDTARAREILITDALKHAAESENPNVSFEPHPETPPGANKVWRVRYTG